MLFIKHFVPSVSFVPNIRDIVIASLWGEPEHCSCMKFSKKSFATEIVGTNDRSDHME